MKRTVLSFAAAVALAGAAFAQDAMMNGPSKDGGAMMSRDANQAANSMMAPAKDTGASGSMMAPAHRTVPYTDLTSAEALAATGPTVLLFAAASDAAGRAEIAKIDSDGSRLGGITVVVVDPGKAAGLKARYRVMAALAYVQIDAEGKAIETWKGGGVDGILAHVRM